MKAHYFLPLSALFVSCHLTSEKTFDKINNLSWLVGKWEHKQEHGTLVEIWKKENDSIFLGESYFINNKDTIHFETIKMYQKDENLTYQSTVIGQNNDEPANFKLTSDSENEFIFENKTQDYPQKIVYKKNKDSSFVNTISGNQQGQYTTETYLMKKK